MKKLSMLLLAAVLLAASCSKKDTNPDSDNQNPNGNDTTDVTGTDSIPDEVKNVLPVKFILTQPKEEGGQGDTTVTTIITYQPGSNKIKEIKEGGYNVQTYFYKDDLIDSIAYGDQGNYVKYEYEDGRLIKESGVWEGTERSRIEYTVLSATEVKAAMYEYDEDNEKLELGDAPVFEFGNQGNVLKAYMGDSWDDAEVKITLEYNDKYSPIANVAGWPVINLTGGIPLGDNTGFQDLIGRRNNPVNVNIFMGQEININYSYKYADSENPDFPTKITVSSGEKTMTLEVEYQ